MTVLMTDREKADLEAFAGRMGVSSGEYIRLAVDNFEQISSEQEAQLSALVAEATKAIPEMRAALDRSCATLEQAHLKIDRLLRESGLRS
jgi:hypothetical protein